jgi:hypothetical protein
MSKDKVRKALYNTFINYLNSNINLIFS